MLLKAQKQHLDHLRQTRHMPPREYRSRNFQVWPTGEVSSAMKTRGTKRWGRLPRCLPARLGGAKRARVEFQNEANRSLPVEKPNIQQKVENKNEPVDAGVSKEELQTMITALLKKKDAGFPDSLLPGQKKPLQTIDLTMEMENSELESTMDQSKIEFSQTSQSQLDQSGFDNLTMDQSMNASVLDELPSEASFSKHLEDRPDTACSTPAKPEASSSQSVDDFTPTGKTPKRKLDGLQDGKILLLRSQN